MSEVTHGKSARLQDGTRITYSKTIESDGAYPRNPSLAAAKEGRLTTRTSGTAGTLTMDAGHGIVDGDIIDIYWANGIAHKATVGTVAVNSVPFTGASGSFGDPSDSLPADETDVTVMVCHEEEFAFTKTNLESLIAGCGGVQMVARVCEADGTDILTIVVHPGTRQYLWNTDDPAGAANPLGEDPGKVFLTHGDSTSSRRPAIEAVLS